MNWNAQPFCFVYIFLFNHCHMHWTIEVRPKVYHAQQQNFPVWSLLAGSGELRCNACTLCQCVCVWHIGVASASAQPRSKANTPPLCIWFTAAHTEQSAQRSFCFSTAASGCVLRERESQLLHRHTFIDALYARSCSSLAVQTHKYTNMQTHCRQLVAFALALLRRCKTNFWEFSNCIYVLWSSFFFALERGGGYSKQ